MKITDIIFIIFCIIFINIGKSTSQETNMEKQIIIVAFGNSTTEQLDHFAEKVYAKRLEEKLRNTGLNVKVINAGISGNTTEDAKKRFKTGVLANNPDYVIIQFGINDSTIDFDAGKTKPKVSRKRYIDNLKYFISILRSKNIKVILMTPNPLRWPPGAIEHFEKSPYDVNNPKGLNIILRDYAQSVRTIAKNTNTHFIDIFRHFETMEVQNKNLLEYIPDGIHPNDTGHEMIADLLYNMLSVKIKNTSASDGKPHGFSIPYIDLSADKHRQIIVDKEEGQYLGHPTTILLEDSKTIITVYPKGHGRGAVVMKKSKDGGLTWSGRLPVPENWATSRETPTIHRVIDPLGIKRLIMFSGLYPARLSVSEDDGKTWTPLKLAGNWGGIVVMGSVVELKTGKGHYMAMFHDDGRFFKKDGVRSEIMTLYKTFSKDGGLTWSYPEEIYKNDIIHLCEPGVIRSPDGKQLAALLRENRRVRNSHVIFSKNEGKTWTNPVELPGSLTGDRHTGKYTPDGRLFISFRDITPDCGSPSEGDWAGWIGTYEDIAKGREGQYRIKLMDNKDRWDCAYPGVEVLPDGTIVTITYGHWTEGQQPYIMCVRFKAEEIDKIAVERY